LIHVVQYLPKTSMRVRHTLSTQPYWRSVLCVHWDLWCGSHHTVKRKGKAIPVTGHGGPYICETSRLPHFLDNQLTDGSEVVSRGWKD
jgi:hypothetical protein